MATKTTYAATASNGRTRTLTTSRAVAFVIFMERDRTERDTSPFAHLASATASRRDLAEKEASSWRSKGWRAEVVPAEVVTP